MAETQTKPKATTKAKAQEKTEEEKFEEELEILDPIAKAVDRTLTHPDESEKTFVQTELAFMPKLRFFRLLSGTIRIAAESEQGGITAFLADAFGSISNESADATEFLETILRLIELVPDFAEEAYLLALNIKPEDQLWAREALETLDDDTGIDILDVFIAQNGKAMRSFFTKRLQKVGKRLSEEVAGEATEQE